MVRGSPRCAALFPFRTQGTIKVIHQHDFTSASGKEKSWVFRDGRLGPMANLIRASSFLCL